MYSGSVPSGWKDANVTPIYKNQRANQRTTGQCG